MAKKRKQQPLLSQRAAKRTQETFWNHPDVAEFFQTIYDGTSDTFELDFEADINLDYEGKRRHCWRVRNKAKGSWVNDLLSTTPYRLSLEWSVSPHANFWGDKRKQLVKTALPSICTKFSKVSRHRCPNGWCCRPDHIQLGSRTSNEEDKHFHYFLKNVKTSRRFMKHFQAECKMQRVWGFAPPE